jgi:hypothetical protein
VLHPASRLAGARLSCSRDLQQVMEMRKAARENLPEGWVHEMVVRRLGDVFEQGVKMAKYRMHGERALAQGYASAQNAWRAQMSHIRTALASMPAPGSILEDLRRLEHTASKAHKRVGRLEGVLSH